MRGWLVLSLRKYRPFAEFNLANGAVKIMEKKSENLDFLKYRERRTEMSDVLLARELLADIGGKGRVSDMLYSALKTLRGMYPHHGEPQKQWNERRLRAWWNRESENVHHYQMVELYRAAAKAKEERELLDAARKEHAAFVAKTAAIAQMLEHTDEDFFGEQIAGLREQSRNLGRSRTGRD